METLMVLGLVVLGFVALAVVAKVGERLAMARDGVRPVSRWEVSAFDLPAQKRNG